MSIKGFLSKWWSLNAYACVKKLFNMVYGGKRVLVTNLYFGCCKMGYTWFAKLSASISIIQVELILSGRHWSVNKS